MLIDNKLILENSKNLNVLYIEDDTNIRIHTRDLFAQYFKSVDIAEDGKVGLKKYQDFFADSGSMYDIIISDIHMPNMNGLEMYEKIKNIYSEQVVIFITAFTDIEYLREAINLGANGFLSKPIDFEELKKVLYKTSQEVADHNLIVQHYQQIEAKNMLNINQQDASSFSSSKDIIKDLETRKEKISHLWVENHIVSERLEVHTIDTEYFRSHYGVKVIEYFLSVIRGDAEAGNCPVIFVMLEFFKHKELPLEDIFMICVLFKNTVTAYILEKYSFNQKLFDDISFILDKNFEGVIINYLQMKENTPDKQVIIQTPVNQEIELEKEYQEIINYSEYVLENDLYELQDLEEDIDSLAISVTDSKLSTVDDCDLLGQKIQRYGMILSNYPLFSELGKYISKLGDNFSENAQLLFDDRHKIENITALIEGFVNDLIVWRKEIFENNIDNYRFLDSSIFSNVDTIIMFIQYEESHDNLDDGEIEFF